VWFERRIGVNATGTLGRGSCRSSAEDARIKAPYAARSVGSGEGLCPFPENFMNFSFQNGVISCILGVLFLRFMYAMDCSCMINFIEVPGCA